MGGGQLYAAVVPSTEVLAMIDNIDASEALKVATSSALCGFQPPATMQCSIAQSSVKYGCPKPCDS